MVVVGCGFGVDEYAVDLGTLQLKSVFESSDDFMHLLHRHLVGQCAVAGYLELVADAPHSNVVDVENGGKPRGRAPQMRFNAAIAFKNLGIFDGRGLILDMGENFRHLGQFVANLVFNAADKAVRLAEGKIFVHFKMLLDPQTAIERLHTDVVQGHIVSQGYGANLVEHAFSERRAGDGVDDDVGSGQHAMHRLGGFAHEIFGSLKGKVA